MLENWYSITYSILCKCKRHYNTPHKTALMGQYTLEYKGPMQLKTIGIAWVAKTKSFAYCCFLECAAGRIGCQLACIVWDPNVA